MIRVINKNQDREIRVKKFDFIKPILSETEVVARRLQAIQDESDRLESAGVYLKERNEALKNENLALRFQNNGLKIENNNKAKELDAINSIIPNRNNSLNLLDKAIAGLSKKYSSEAKEKRSKLAKIKIDEASYLEVQKKHDLLKKQIDKLDKEINVKKLEVNTVKQEHKKNSEASRQAQKEYESFKHMQSTTLKSMKFYATRLNRYYRELQLPPPIDMPKL